jgi:cyanuric acid amidohydrolase
MNLQRVGMFVCPMRTPNDMSELEKLLNTRVAPETVVALVGKTEGTGLHNDWGRVVADQGIRAVLASRFGITPEGVADHVVLILSGGTPGVITPHVTVITREWLQAEASPTAGGLVVGVASSEPIAPEEIGRVGQIGKVAAAVRQAAEDAGVPDSRDVHLVMVKAPTLTLAAIGDAEARGQTVVTRDLSIGEHGAVCFSNDASALGVAVALGEVSADDVSDEVVRRDWSLCSEVAMTSSGGEKRHAEVLLLANSASSVGELRVGHSVMRDLIDADGVKAALRAAGLSFGCCPSGEDQQRVVQVFAKACIPGSDLVRGQRVTLLDDHDGFHVAKALGGELVASVIGRTTVFVSGGERNSHQGPPGGNPVAAVVRSVQTRGGA